MLDFDHQRPSMFPAAISLTDVTSSLGMAVDDKYSPGHVFVRQPYSLQIIQLEETAPPPRHSDASSVASSSYWSSEYSESANSEDDDEEEEEEGDDCSSYCSSDLPPQENEMAEDAEPSAHPTSADTSSVRMKRIIAWREDFYAQAGASLSGASLPSLKRKLDIDQNDDDNVSHSSKRSRSESSCFSSSRSSSISSLGMHSCPACDTFFDTQQSLRQHGFDAKTNNEACSAAVEYEFE